MISISDMLTAIKKVEAEHGSAPSKAFARSSYLESLRVVEDGGISSLLGMPLHRADHLPKGLLCLLMNADGRPAGMIVDETYQPSQAKVVHPDAGGSTEAMQAPVEAWDKLRGGS